jgi:hypothetical protein
VPGHVPGFYLRTVIVTAAVYRGLGSELRPCGLTPPRNLPAPGRRHSVYIVLTTSHAAVFLVNSRFPLVSAASSGSRREACHPTEALLLPKLRRYFAEFLNHSSPDRLGILYPPTCVGLGYGRRVNSLDAFLGSMGSVTMP